MLHFLRIKASVNIFNVNIKLKMPPTKHILDMKDSHQQNLNNHYNAAFQNIVGKGKQEGHDGPGLLT